MSRVFEGLSFQDIQGSEFFKGLLSFQGVSYEFLWTQNVFF